MESKKYTKRIIFLAGGSASGKTTFRNILFPGMPGIDPDAAKESIRGYDPKAPWTVHEESKRLTREEWLRFLQGEESFVYDTTGGNVDRIKMELQEAETAGFEIELCWIFCPIEQALENSAYRASLPNGRYLPEEIVTESHERVKAAMPHLLPLFETYEIIRNERRTA